MTKEVINVQKLGAPNFIDLSTFDRLWLPGYGNSASEEEIIPETLKLYRYRMCMSGCNHCRIQHSFKNNNCWRTQNPYQTDIPYKQGYAHFFSQTEYTPYLKHYNHNYRCISTRKTNSKIYISTFSIVRS